MSYLGLETIRRGNTAACVEDIFKIHFPNAKSVIDCTYGAGRFWKWNHELRITGVDVDPPGPAADGVDLFVMDYRHLEATFAPGEFDVLCFDPVFIFSKGIRRVIGTKRFFRGAEDVEAGLRTHSKVALEKPRNPKDLLAHYRRIFEQRQVATQGMILKGQDLIVNKPDWWSFHVYQLGLEMGLGEPTDILIQHSPAHRMRDPRWKNQHYFRRAHCFYMVYKW